MRLKKTIVGGTAAVALGLAALVGTGTAFAATPAPAPGGQPSTVAPAVEPVGPDADTLQEGDQTTPDTGTEAADPAESATASATESAAGSDGPGGHADPAGEVDHQFDGQE